MNTASSPYNILLSRAISSTYDDDDNDDISILYLTNLSKQAFTFWFSFLGLLSNWDYRMYSMILKNFNHILVFLTRNLPTCSKLWGSKVFPSSPVMLAYPITKVDAGYNSACVSAWYAFWKSFHQGAHCFLAVPPVGLCIFCTLSQQRQGIMTFSINPYKNMH